MEILKFGDSPAPKRSNSGGRKTGPMIIAGLMVAMMGMSTTLAGTITISSTGNIEFGQGVVNTAACDNSITVTPYTIFSNVTGSDTFTVNAVKLSGITGGTGTNDACLGKTFTIKAYAGSTQIGMSTSNNAATSASTETIVFTVPSTDVKADKGVTLSPTAKYGDQETSDGADTTAGFWSSSGITVTLAQNDGWSGTDTGVLLIAGLRISSAVTRFTIETSGS